MTGRDPMASTDDERRQAPRTLEQITVAMLDGSREFRTETKNLSASGAYCTLDRFIPPMSKLQLTFELPQGGRKVKIRCAGVVVRIEPVVVNAEQMRYYVALFFTELSERHRAAISRFVRERLAALESSS